MENGYVFLGKLPKKIREALDLGLYIVCCILGMVAGIKVVFVFFSSFSDYELWGCIATLVVGVTNVVALRFYVLVRGVCTIFSVKKKEIEKLEDSTEYFIYGIGTIVLQLTTIFYFSEPSSTYSALYGMGALTLNDLIREFTPGIVLLFLMNKCDEKTKENIEAEDKTKFYKEVGKRYLMKILHKAGDFADGRNNKEYEYMTSDTTQNLHEDPNGVQNAGLYCTECGEKVEADWKNCPHCGKELR